MVTTELKISIISAIKEDRKNFSSDGKHSKKLDINKSGYSQVIDGKTERVLSETE